MEDGLIIEGGLIIEDGLIIESKYRVKVEIQSVNNIS